MSDLKFPITCEQFESGLSDYIDGTMPAGERAAMDVHSAACAQCRALVADVRKIVVDAAALPSLTPSRDLWAGISERLDTPVVSIGAAASVPVKHSRGISFRVFAAAAVLLVTVSSGITYVATRGNSAGDASTDVTSLASGTPSAAGVSGTSGSTVATVAPSSGVPVSTQSGTASSGRSESAGNIPATVASTGTDSPQASPVANSASAPRSASDRPGTTRYASRIENTTEFAYEREITAMRRIVDERLGDLDSVTVVEIERNLRIIDKAINDSRRALQSDPRSRFLSKQLDRALENKLDILRRIALL